MKFVSNRTLLMRLGLRGGIYAELGVFRGRCAEMIVNNCHPEEMYLIDGWESVEYHTPADTNGEPFNCRDKDLWVDVRHEVEERFKDHENVHIIQGDTSEEISKFPDHYFDFIYIDANHTYEGCSGDLRAAAPKVKRGGLLGGHDLCAQFPGVIASVLEFSHQHPEFVPYAITKDGFPSFLFQLRGEYE